MCGNLDMIEYVFFLFGLIFLHISLFMTGLILGVSISFQIILFQFGLGASAHYVILELYAQGNILLTDSEFTVLTLLRSHRSVELISCLVSLL